MIVRTASACYPFIYNTFSRCYRLKTSSHTLGQAEHTIEYQTETSTFPWRLACIESETGLSPLIRQLVGLGAHIILLRCM